MRRILAVALSFAGIAVCAFGDDPLEGTWKLNLAKSKQGSSGNAPVKEETIIISIKDEKAMVVITGTREDGSAMSTRFNAPINGGLVEYTEGGPGTGASVDLKRIDKYTTDLISTRDGKVVGTNHVVLSKDGRTMTGSFHGVGADGKTFDSRLTFEKR